tara:strand:- start:1112 stop:3469 length:2358 start_codon:yes stop_codon:yes gene_type:complete
MRRVVPVREPCPSLPEPTKPKKSVKPFGREEVFAFDTETTRCGKKMFKSIQFSWYEGGTLRNHVIFEKNWFDKESFGMEDLPCEKGVTTLHEVNDESELREQAQRMYEALMYNDEPKVKRNTKGRMTRTRRKIKRCAVAFNANFDLGVIADRTTLDPNFVLGGMEGAGCRFHFQSGKRIEKDAEYGMNIEVLYLGAFNVPFASKRGEIWDIMPLTRNIWGAPNLASVSRVLGMKKLVDEGENSLRYAVMDSYITLEACIRLTEELERMNFKGAPDRFVSGATVAKDMMAQHYTPFYLTQKQHEMVWPAYFGGMTGALDMNAMREPVYDVIYGDLDGAYNASAQKLRVFEWDGCKNVDSKTCEIIIDEVRKNPSRFWYYGSLHMRVKGDFDNVPLRVGTCGQNGTPSKSEGLVWGRIRNYETTLTLGDYLHSKPHDNVEILEGVMATFGNNSPCLFKMCADERKKYPKFDKNGKKIVENFVPNTWFKLAGNTIYGSFANRNGKEREKSGKWFNALVASSITGSIRHAMWTVNHASDAYYNDTDSALTTVEGFHKAVEALKPLGIGFSNKTNDEIDGCKVAEVAVIQGSKRYAMMSEKGEFGGKCHGLGSWYVLFGGKVQSVAHNEEILHAVWAFNYPEVFGDPNEDLLNLNVFHKFSIRTKVISDRVKEYARRKYGVALKETSAYGKAGNFGLLSPKIIEGRVEVEVSFEADEADRLSDLTLRQVAFSWGSAYDKKFDYANHRRWLFDGADIVNVQAVEHTQNLVSAVELSDSDISVHVSHDSGGE